MRMGIRRALYGKMAGDTTLSQLLGTPADGYSHAIYHQQAPTDAQFPFIIFSKSSGTAMEAATKPTALKTDIWLVKAVDEGSTSDLAEAIADRLDDLLEDATLSISGGHLRYLRSQSDVDYPELAEGTVYRHVGANYRLVVEPT